jgi:hypothetical protein
MTKAKAWYEKLPQSVEARNRRKEPRIPKGRGWRKFMQLLEASPKGEVTFRREIQAELRSGTMICYEGTEYGPTGRLQRQVWYKKVK